MKVAIEQIFNGSIPQVAIGGAYDPTKINRGKHTGQFNLGSGEVDKFIGPAPIGMGNTGESSLAIPANMLHPLKITDDLFWVFAADGAASAGTRRFQLWTFVPSTNTYTFIGAIIITFPVTGNSTITSFRAVLQNYTVGSISASGTALTGSGTTWLTGLSVGSRIGFGSTDPQAITNWFEISAINSDTSITLNRSAGTISAGTPYVIQDLMLLMLQRNITTVTNGAALFIAKGLSFLDFRNPASTIPAATTVDKIKAVYGITSAFPANYSYLVGVDALTFTSWVDQNASITVNDTATTAIRFTWTNFRQPLTSLVSGQQSGLADQAGLLLSNIGLVNNSRLGSISTAQGGVQCIFWYTNTNVYATRVSDVLTGNYAAYLSATLTESAPGGSNTNLTGGTFAGIDVNEAIDKVIITTSLGTVYVTDFTSPFSRRCNLISPQTPSVSRILSSPTYVHTITAALIPYTFSVDGWMFYLYSLSTAPSFNAFSAYPLAADLSYQSSINNRIICPKISLGTTPTSFYRVLVNCAKNIGDSTFGVTPDMYTIEYRTSGIDDNSGAWTSVNQDGDLSKVLLSSNIQFAIRFRTAGVMMLPARILSLSLVYETSDGLPSQHRWDNDDFNLANNIFGFKQVERFYSTPYIHTIDIYRQDTNALVLTQNSQGNANGNFQYWNGTTWVNGLDGDSVGLRRRFVPTASLPATSLYANISYVIVPESILSGAVMYVDAANSASYPGPSQPGPAPKWYDISGASPSMTMDLDPSYWATGSGYPTFDSVDGGGSWDFSFFNGGGTSNSIPNLITPTSGFTIGIWLKLKQFNTWSSFTGLYNGDALICFLTQPSFTGVNSDASVYIYGSISSQTIFAKFDNTWSTQSGIVGSGYTASDLNTWVYLVFTVNCAAGGAITSYKNGVQQSTSTLSNALNLANTRVIWSGYNATGIGNSGRGSSAKYGVIQIYNRILSASEIAQNFTANRYRFGL